MVNGSRYNHISKISLGSSTLKVSKVVLRLKGLIFSTSPGSREKPEWAQVIWWHTCTGPVLTSWISRSGEGSRRGSQAEHTGHRASYAGVRGGSRKRHFSFSAVSPSEPKALQASPAPLYTFTNSPGVYLIICLSTWWWVPWGLG